MSEPAKKSTMEEVWAAIKATEEARLRGEEARIRGDEALRDTIRKGEEVRIKGEKALQESQKALQESQMKTKESLRQTQKVVQETGKEVQKLNESLKEANGNFNNKWGHFLENLLEGDLVNLLKEWDIKVERTLPNVTVKRPNGIIVAEYDLLAINGAEIVVVEVKTTLEKDTVGRFVEKLIDFKNQLPVYKDKTLYGAVAYMRLKSKDYSKKFKHEDASVLAQEKGLFLIQSPGGAKDMSKIVNREGFRPAEF